MLKKCIFIIQLMVRVTLEGSCGKGKGSTEVIHLQFESDGTVDAGGAPEWWVGTIPPQPVGTKLRYRIGARRLMSQVCFHFLNLI